MIPVTRQLSGLGTQACLYLSQPETDQDRIMNPYLSSRCKIGLFEYDTSEVLSTVCDDSHLSMTVLPICYSL